MEMIGGVLLLWLMHAGIAAGLTAPVVYLGRRRANWRSWELLATVLPFCVWLALMFSEFSTGWKTMSNLVEPLYFSLAVPVAAMVRVIVGTRIDERICAAILMVALCLIATAVFFFVPGLPE